ncbi:MAG TPA: 50S ribosomal protein L18 [Bdellovibrionales bacterium]|nr:50S ribosomal protein L18 [Bdellovibrionales bacterium]
MRLKFKRSTDSKTVNRRKKKVRIRKTVMGSTERPRLSIFKSVRHVYAQVIDDNTGRTLVAASTLEKSLSEKSGKEAAALIGQTVAQRAKEMNIESVVFDRNGYLYHGRVKALADAAREAGLKF